MQTFLFEFHVIKISITAMKYTLIICYQNIQKNIQKNNKKNNKSKKERQLPTATIITSVPSREGSPSSILNSRLG
jgi:hypothetical protein